MRQYRMEYSQKFTIIQYLPKYHNLASVVVLWQYSIHNVTIVHSKFNNSNLGSQR